jgi:hypothetical protein
MTTNVHFTGCTGIKVRDKVSVEDDCNINVGGPKVIFYMGDNKDDPENFEVHGNNTQVTANIIIPHGDLHVTGGDENNCIMTGWFITEKLNSDGRNVTWNMYDCVAPPMARGEITKVTAIETKQNPVPIAESFGVKVSPDPSATEFSIRVTGSSDELISVRILDLSGKVLETRTSISRGSTVTVGGNLISGTYFAEVIQGSNRQVVKLVKLR